MSFDVPSSNPLVMQYVTSGLGDFRGAILYGLGAAAAWFNEHLAFVA